MKKIDFNYGEIVYKEVLDNGLTVYLYPTNKSKNFYITVSTHFGAEVMSYKKNNKVYDVTKGSAHFLEHRVMDFTKNVDAMNKINELGSIVNAYTTYKGTNYNLYGVEDIYTNMGLLFDRVFKANIKKEDVEMERGNLNSQIALGRGFTSGSSTQSTGATNTQGMCYGNPNSGTYRMKLFGLEDLWGNVHQFISGLYCDSNRNLLTTTDNFGVNTSADAWEYNVSSGVTNDISGYMIESQGTNNSGFITKAKGGSSTIYYSDDVYLYASRFPYVGGSWSSSDLAGVFSCYVTYNEKYLGRYGMLRNNWYELKVGNVYGPGYPGVAASAGCWCAAAR